MTFYSKKDYKFLFFQRGAHRLNKYDAILQHKKTKKIVIVSFGGIRPNGIPYTQYKDKALGLYSHYDNYDEKKRENYLKRHLIDINKPFSPSWFSRVFLWN